MSRFLMAVAAVLAIQLEVFAVAQQPEPAPVPAPQKAVVWFAHDPLAMHRFDENPVITRRLVDQVVCATTGKRDIAAAWRTLVSPGDRVGLKVATAGGALFSTRIGVVQAVLDGLEKAGVPRKSVIVWDREAAGLRAAGFNSKQLGCRVCSIDPPSGWDRDSVLTAPVMGKLIWGDLLFVEKAAKSKGRNASEVDQLSGISHLAKIVSRDVTKIVNLPTLSDELGCGVAGALYHATVPNIDNWRRFTQPDHGAAESLPAIYADEHLGPKIVLHILDGLIARYAGGPAANPNYAYDHATIYASKDPVALDATAFRLIEDWRTQAKLPSIAKDAEWLSSAAASGLGVFAEEGIELKDSALAP